MLMSPTLTGLSISSSIVVSVLVLLSSEAVGAVVLVPLLEHAASETAVAAACHYSCEYSFEIDHKNLLNVTCAIVYTHLCYDFITISTFIQFTF